LLVPVKGVSIHSCFVGILPYLWHCWELTLLAQPLVVMSNNPKIGSDSVLSLVSLISPIPYGGDYRPYFTIHDNDFKDFTTKTQACLMCLKRQAANQHNKNRPLQMSS